jgi:hypothetical protein
VTAQELSRLLIEAADADIDPKVQAYVNRLMLRIASQSSLSMYLVDQTTFKPGIAGSTSDQVEDGDFNEGDKDSDETVIVQLSFRRLPKEIIAPLLRMIAAPRDPKLFQFIKDGQARTGIHIELKSTDFPGEEIDYAF